MANIILIVFGLSTHINTAYLWSFKNQDENARSMIKNRPSRAVGCSVDFSFLEPTPIFERDGQLIRPQKSARIDFEDNEKITAICAGSGNVLIHKQAGVLRPQIAVLACQNEDYFTSDWISMAVKLSQVICLFHPPSVETKTNTCASGGSLIKVGVQGTQVWNTFSSCFNEEKADVIYTQHILTPENKATSYAKRPGNFSQGTFFHGLSVNNLYKMETQIKTFATILGSIEMAEKYLNKGTFLTRGHLSPKSDFSFNFEQRATFTFINVAPQWKKFNEGNWQKLEQKLKTRISHGKINAEIYTGTWGLMTLKDNHEVSQPLYLSPFDRKIPVPLWFYKVVRDTANNKSTAFIGINNPYLTISEAVALTFCPDKCAGNQYFSWLPWNNRSPKFGYSICCDVNDFRKVVNVLPLFPVSGLFY